MGCDNLSKTDNINDKKFQDLSGWSGKSLQELLARIADYPYDEVRVYTVTTTKFIEKSNSVEHEGSGPNLEGGLATLCTCKHSMRLNHTCDEWKGKWILGLTSRAKNNGFSGQHYLLYMMRVEKAFNSHKEMYEYLKINNKKSLQTKNSINNRLGDIFQPTDDCTNFTDPSMYEKPHNKHSHGSGKSTHWHQDISYTENKCAPLLLGDKENTFVWPKPMIIFDQKRGSGNMKLTLEDLYLFLSSSKTIQQGDYFN